MAKSIRAPVGRGGVNQAPDVRTVQELLNGVPPAWGGPTPKLALDGLIGPKTIGAIGDFQTTQFGTVFQADFRVDPGQMTITRLNQIVDSGLAPSGFFRLSREPIDHVRQPSNMVCWAAAGTMLVSARDLVSQPIRTVMQTADANDPGYNYLDKFNANQGLPPGDTGRYTGAIGLNVGPPASFSVTGWRSMIASRGAVGVVGLSPFLHIRVVTEMFGDGSPFGTFFTVHDPGTAFPYQEVFATFAHRYESAAFINDRMDQLWHR